MGRWIVVLLAALFPVIAEAQEASHSWPGLAQSGLSGLKVYVLEDSGKETSGRLLSLTPDSMDLLVDGTQRHFEAAYVRRIQKQGDSLRNGALIGALVGLGMGVLGAIMSDCSEAAENCPGTRTALVLISTGVSAAIGTGIDALIVGRTVLYEATNGPLKIGVETSSLSAHRRQAGVRLSLRW